MKKRILSMALALALALSLCVPALAEEEPAADQPEYRLASITGEIGGPRTFTYDQGGWRPTAVYDGNGNAVVTASYDAAGRVTSLENDVGVYTYEYDENGNLLSSSSHYITYSMEDGTEIACDTNYVYTYDTNGNRIRYELTYVLGDETTVTEREYTYDDAGLMLSSKSYTNGELASEEQCTYDDAGNLLLSETTSTDGSVRSAEYTYDDAGNLLRKETATDGMTEYIDTYDEAGNMLSETTYSDGEVSGETTYTYDSEGRKIQEDYTNDVAAGSTEYVYTPLLTFELHEYSAGNDLRYILTDSMNVYVYESALFYSTEPQFAYDENGYVTQIDYSDSYSNNFSIDFTYEPVA